MGITRIEPTIYFVRDNWALRQAVDVSLTLPSASDACRLEVTWEGGSSTHPLPVLAAGASTQRIFFPDLRRPVSVRFALFQGDELLDDLIVQWAPQRHWTVYLCQYSHFDAGYTDLPSFVLDEYLPMLDQVLDWCEETESWSEEVRFHYTIEQAWVAWHYARHRDAAQMERLARYARAGQIEVNAFFGNLISELLGPEELVRALYPAFALQRRYGIPIRTAEHNDIPGMNWAYATVLAEAGIRYLAPGIPDYHRWGSKPCRPNYPESQLLPRGCPQAVYWEAQNGTRLLLYLHTQGADGDRQADLSNLPRVLLQLEQAGYPYSVLRYLVSGGFRDNAPPIFDWAIAAREWNRRWAFPRLVMGNNHRFFTALEAELGSAVPTVRGDYPGTDYVIGALSTTQETGTSRLATDRLLSAERLGSVAAHTAWVPYPVRDLEQAYLDLLAADEHVWGLASVSGWAKEAHHRERAVYSARAMALAEDVTVKSAHAIADQVMLHEPGYSIVVFNPLEFERTGPVELPFIQEPLCHAPMFAASAAGGEAAARVRHASPLLGRAPFFLPEAYLADDFHLEDCATGEVVPHERVALDSEMEASPFAAERFAEGQARPRNRHHVLFVPPPVPALGYRTLRLVPGRQRSAVATDLSSGPDWIENAHYRITFNPESGAVLSLFDKAGDRELVDRTAPFVLGELFGRTIGNGEPVRAEGARLVRVDRGNVRVRVITDQPLPGVPQCRREILLYRGLPWVEVRLRALKDAGGLSRFLVAFPFAVPQPRFVREGTFGAIRPIEDQWPQTCTNVFCAQHWVHVGPATGAWGITLSAREAPVWQFSALWPDAISPAHVGVQETDIDTAFLSDPAQLDRGHLYSYVACNNFRTNFYVSQPGIFLQRYAVAAASGDWRSGRARRFGWGFCLPLVPALVEGPRRGILPEMRAFGSINPPNVALCTIKRAEDGCGTIVRLVETEGKTCEAEVYLPFLDFKHVVQTDVVERGARPLPVDGHRVSVRLRAWGMATLRLFSE